MNYIFDTNSFQIVSRYFPSRFPSFWVLFNNYVEDGRIISVKEVLGELERNLDSRGQYMVSWIKQHKNIFFVPSAEEMMFIQEIFKVKHFQQLVKSENRLKGNPVADPFIIAAAKIKEACVVTEEKKKNNAARIPNVCDYFGIKWTNLEGFMEAENWSF
jgi:hypothetical protein